MWLGSFWEACEIREARESVLLFECLHGGVEQPFWHRRGWGERDGMREEPECLIINLVALLSKVYVQVCIVHQQTQVEAFWIWRSFPCIDEQSTMYTVWLHTFAHCMACCCMAYVISVRPSLSCWRGSLHLQITCQMYYKMLRTGQTCIIMCKSNHIFNSNFRCCEWS